MPSHQTENATIQEAIIASYQSLLASSVRMLHKAQDEDWVSLIDEESSYVAQVERLTRLESGMVLEPAQVVRKAELLAQILVQDREIRERLAQRKAELSRLIGQSQRQRQLNRAYSSSSNTP